MLIYVFFPYSWEELDTNNPLDAIKETVFFQIMELAFDQGSLLYIYHMFILFLNIFIYVRIFIYLNQPFL